MENKININNLHNLIDYEASKFTCAEVELKNHLTVWKDHATAVELKMVLQQYLEFVNQHIDRLEGFFNDESFNSLSITHRIMHAYIEETNEQLSFCTNADIKNACLVACVQSINHYKISSYGTAAAFANALAFPSAAQLFHEAELNEKQIDQRLSQLAARLNESAKSPIALKY